MVKTGEEKNTKKTRSATLAFFVKKIQESIDTFFADLCNLYRKLSGRCRGLGPELAPRAMREKPGPYQINENPTLSALGKLTPRTRELRYQWCNAAAGSAFGLAAPISKRTQWCNAADGSAFGLAAPISKLSVA